jgi:hemerythrin-like domain-containing protein
MADARDVFSVLTLDHEEVKAILAELVAAPPDKPQETKDLAERLVIEESKHEAVEEMHFWPAVQERVPGGEELTKQALKQEDEGKEVLEKLRKATPGDGEFAKLVAAFSQAGHEHIAFEEEQVWPKLRAVLTPEEANEMGAKLQEAKENAPTRPHPNAPSSPGAQKAAGPVAGLLDKARDALGNRR